MLVSPVPDSHRALCPSSRPPSDAPDVRIPVPLGPNRRPRVGPSCRPLPERGGAG